MPDSGKPVRMMAKFQPAWCAVTTHKLRVQAYSAVQSAPIRVPATIVVASSGALAGALDKCIAANTSD